MESWEERLMSEFDEGWRQWTDFGDVAAYLGYARNADEIETEAAEAGLADSPIGFLLKAEPDADAELLKEIVVDAHESEMIESWEEMNPRPLTREEAREAYEADETDAKIKEAI